MLASFHANAKAGHNNISCYRTRCAGHTPFRSVRALCTPPVDTAQGGSPPGGGGNRLPRAGHSDDEPNAGREKGGFLQQSLAKPSEFAAVITITLALGAGGAWFSSHFLSTKTYDWKDRSRKSDRWPTCAAVEGMLEEALTPLVPLPEAVKRLEQALEALSSQVGEIRMTMADMKVMMRYTMEGQVMLEKQVHGLRALLVKCGLVAGAIAATHFCEKEHRRRSGGG